jgi:hypothetical protein
MYTYLFQIYYKKKVCLSFLNREVYKVIILSALSSEIFQDGSTWLTVSTFKLEEEICVITYKSSQFVRNKITALKIPSMILWKCCVIPSVKVSVSVALFCSSPFAFAL